MPDELSQDERVALERILVTNEVPCDCGVEPGPDEDWFATLDDHQRSCPVRSWIESWLAHRAYAREQEGDLRQEWEKAHDALGELVGRLWRAGGTA